MIGPQRRQAIGRCRRPNTPLGGAAGKVVEFMTRITVTGLALEETAV